MVICTQTWNGDSNWFWISFESCLVKFMCVFGVWTKTVPIISVDCYWISSYKHLMHCHIVSSFLIFFSFHLLTIISCIVTLSHHLRHRFHMDVPVLFTRLSLSIQEIQGIMTRSSVGPMVCLSLSTIKYRLFGIKIKFRHKKKIQLFNESKCYWV